MKLIGLLVLLGLLSLVEGEVVDMFDKCSAFSPSTPPVLPDQNRYKLICQKYKGEYRYATLYDTRNKIPVYSAYRYKRPGQKKKIANWMIEPQLDIHDGSPEMKSEDEVRPVGEHQALHGDYKDTLYTKGHVYPYDHAYDQEQADSTFTHTNVAPQRLADNNIDWTQAEKAIKEDMDGKCNLDSTYVVTGVIPGSKTIDKENDEGEIIKQINVPSHYWTAYCCKDRNDPNRFTSEAYIMEMRYRTEEEAKKDPIKPTSTTVTVLNDSIKKLYNDKLEEGHKITDFRLFGTLENCH